MTTRWSRVCQRAFPILVAAALAIVAAVGLARLVAILLS
jgi:hypothetical protein